MTHKPQDEEREERITQEVLVKREAALPGYP